MKWKFVFAAVVALLAFSVHSVSAIGVLTDLSSSDTNNWIGSRTLFSISGFNDKIYIGGQTGTFGYYSPATNITSNLNETNNWIGTSSVSDIKTYNSSLVFIGVSTSNLAVFGIYNSLTNVTYKINVSEIGWSMGGQPTFHLQPISDTTVFISGLNNGSGTYNPAANTSVFLTSSFFPAAGSGSYKISAYNSTAIYGVDGGGSSNLSIYDIPSNTTKSLGTVMTWRGAKVIRSISAYNSSAVYIVGADATEKKM